MLAVSIMAGMFLGLIWDAYRLIRHYGKLNAAATVIGDILYWIISIKLSTQLILDISFGNVRFFILLGFLAGALLYFYGISRYILKLFIFIIDSMESFTLWEMALAIFNSLFFKVLLAL